MSLARTRCPRGAGEASAILNNSHTLWSILGPSRGGPLGRTNVPGGAFAMLTSRARYTYSPVPAQSQSTPMLPTAQWLSRYSVLTVQAQATDSPLAVHCEDRSTSPRRVYSQPMDSPLAVNSQTLRVCSESTHNSEPSVSLFLFRSLSPGVIVWPSLASLAFSLGAWHAPA